MPLYTKQQIRDHNNLTFRPSRKTINDSIKPFQVLSLTVSTINWNKPKSLKKLIMIIQEKNMYKYSILIQPSVE